ncbi:unnamed protein product [Discula destructiva]
MITLTSMLFAAWILTGAHCAAAQDASTNCSLGIGRHSGSDSWDLTVYKVPQSAQRQDWDILATLKGQHMGEGDSITIPKSAGVPQAITITNVDDAPAFDYILPEQSLDYQQHWVSDGGWHT